MITNNNLENECSICQENYLGGPYSHAPVSLQCGHVFGRRCIVKWSKESLTCPLCRHEISSQEFAMPESFMRRVLSERTIVIGLTAFSHYLFDDRQESIRVHAAFIFFATSFMTNLFLVSEATNWCLNGRSNPLPRAKRLIESQLRFALNIIIGSLVGVALTSLTNIFHNGYVSNSGPG